MRPIFPYAISLAISAAFGHPAPTEPVPQWKKEVQTLNITEGKSNLTLQYSGAPHLVMILQLVVPSDLFGQQTHLGAWLDRRGETRGIAPVAAWYSRGDKVFEFDVTSHLAGTAAVKLEFLYIKDTERTEGEAILVNRSPGGPQPTQTPDLNNMLMAL